MTMLVIGILSIFGAVFLILILIGCSRTQRYLQDIIEIETLVRCGRVTGENFQHIIQLFQLISNNDKDKARTRKAWDKFVTKYKYDEKTTDNISSDSN